MAFEGATPYVLVLIGAGQKVAIDLDEPGWRTKHASALHEPGMWVLANKTTSAPVLTMTVFDGEEPYYTSRVIGTAFLPPPDAVGKTQEQMAEVREKAEVRAFGIGKQYADGHFDRMWILPTGAVCVGDDVDALGAEMAKIKAFTLLRSTNDGPKDQEGRREEARRRRDERLAGRRSRNGRGSR